MLVYQRVIIDFIFEPGIWWILGEKIWRFCPITEAGGLSRLVKSIEAKVQEKAESWSNERLKSPWLVGRFWMILNWCRLVFASKELSNFNKDIAWGLSFCYFTLLFLGRTYIFLLEFLWKSGFFDVTFAFMQRSHGCRILASCRRSLKVELLLKGANGLGLNAETLLQVESTCIYIYVYIWMYLYLSLFFCGFLDSVVSLRFFGANIDGSHGDFWDWTFVRKEETGVDAKKSWDALRIWGCFEEGGSSTQK